MEYDNTIVPMVIDNQYKNYDRIVLYGRMYNPASSHYDILGQTVVNCDRCRKVGIPISYGIPNENFDICVDCYNVVYNNMQQIGKVHGDIYKAPFVPQDDPLTLEAVWYALLRFHLSKENVKALQGE